MQLTLRYHVVSASGCHLSSVSTPRTRPQFVHAPHRVCRMQVRPTATLAAAPSIGTNAPSMEPVQEPSVVRDVRPCKYAFCTLNANLPPSRTLLVMSLHEALPPLYFLTRPPSRSFSSINFADCFRGELPRHRCQFRR